MTNDDKYEYRHADGSRFCHPKGDPRYVALDVGTMTGGIDAETVEQIRRDARRALPERRAPHSWHVIDLTIDAAIAALARQSLPASGGIDAETVAQALRNLAVESVRFSTWAAGQGICPVTGEDARSPEDFWAEWTDATAIDDNWRWTTVADMLDAALARQSLPASGEVERAMQGAEATESGPNGRGGVRVVVHFPRPGDEHRLRELLTHAAITPASGEGESCG